MTLDNELQSPYIMGNHAFPALWRYLLPEDAEWLKWPAERKATCATCPKVTEGVHHASTRCCTYFPEVPNFLLGFALQDPKSQSLIETQIEIGHILPTGQQIDAGQYRTAVESYAEDLFGELTHLVCPFLNPETIECGVYAYRNSVCSTFFCENDHGEPGRKFWEKTQDLVGHIEIALSQAVMQALGIDVEQYMATLDTWGDDIDGSFVEGAGWSLELRKQLWGDWFNREAEFLVEASMWVEERKKQLYTLATEQTLYEARLFEGAVRQWLPEKIRSHASQVNSDPSGPVESPVSEFWYQVQLITRQLWEIPFENGKWQLNPLAQLPLIAAEGEALVQLKKPKESRSAPVLRVSETQQALLHVFKEPQVFNEALMESAELQALSESREFLAECLRLGVLVEYKKN